MLATWILYRRRRYLHIVSLANAYRELHGKKKNGERTDVFAPLLYVVGYWSSFFINILYASASAGMAYAAITMNPVVTEGW